MRNKTTQRRGWIVMCVPGRSDSDASSYFAYNLETSRSLSALSPEHAKQLCETRNAAQNAKKN